MATKYRGTVYGDRFPFTFDTEASNYHVAAARIVTSWERRFKGEKRPAMLTIKITRG
jgi:hypothetical protein